MTSTTTFRSPAGTGCASGLGLVGVIGSLLVAAATTIFIDRAEGSLVKGLGRGVPEGLAAAVGFVLLGRAVGLLPRV